MLHALSRLPNRHLRPARRGGPGPPRGAVERAPRELRCLPDFAAEADALHRSAWARPGGADARSHPGDPPRDRPRSAGATRRPRAHVGLRVCLALIGVPPDRASRIPALSSATTPGSRCTPRVTSVRSPRRSRWASCSWPGDPSAPRGCSRWPPRWSPSSSGRPCSTSSPARPAAFGETGHVTEIVGLVRSPGCSHGPDPLRRPRGSRPASA